MATTTNKSWTKPGGRLVDGSPSVFHYYNSDESGFGTNGDILQFDQPHGLPQDTCVIQVNLSLGQFDSHATPTGTFDVILTDGSTSYDLIKSWAGGRTATVGDSHNSPGTGTTNEVTGFGVELTTTSWYIQLKQTAAFATATSSARFVCLDVFVLAVS